MIQKKENMDNLGLIVALLGSAFTIVAAMIAMMLWVRSEANSDRRDIVNLIIEIKEDGHRFRNDITEINRNFVTESKEFHTRLCEIESKRR